MKYYSSIIPKGEIRIHSFGGGRGGLVKEVTHACTPNLLETREQAPRSDIFLSLQEPAFPNVGRWANNLWGKGYNANTNFEVGSGNINPCADTVRSLHLVWCALLGALYPTWPVLLPSRSFFRRDDRVFPQEACTSLGAFHGPTILRDHGHLLWRSLEWFNCFPS